ncbi:MAG: glycosyltransferase [Chloroflexi bacterium]|nr:glycosyltransferase [Chloroflexota bacterium]
MARDRDEGIGVDVFTRSQDEHQPHVKHDLGCGNSVVHVPAGPEVPLPRSALYAHLPQFVQGIRRFQAETGSRYDLIHSHYWLSGCASRELQRHWRAPGGDRGLPLIQMFHTLGHMKTRVAQRPADAEDMLRIRSESQILGFADRIMAATLAERAQLQWLYRADVRNVVILPPGVDLNLFSHIPRKQARQLIGVSPDDRLLLFAGRIEPLKGVDTLLEAIALMKRRGKPGTERVCVAIIGGDPSGTQAQENAEMARLQQLCEQLGLGDVVAFLGKREQDSLRNYYAAAEAVVMPSHYESFGMVALEAMASGTPVVASEVGGLAFLVPDAVTGFHVPDHDPDALCHRLEQLLTDDALRRRLGQQAARYAENYGWPIIAGRIIKLYAEVMQEAQRVARDVPA